MTFRNICSVLCQHARWQFKRQSVKKETAAFWGLENAKNNGNTKRTPYILICYQLYCPKIVETITCKKPTYFNKSLISIKQITWFYLNMQFCWTQTSKWQKKSQSGDSDSNRKMRSLRHIKWRKQCNLSSECPMSS